MTRRVPLPEPVARIYKATAELEALYPGRKFTPDGHLVGSIGEVIAAEALGLKLYFIWPQPDRRESFRERAARRRARFVRSRSRNCFRKNRTGRFHVRRG